MKENFEFISREEKLDAEQTRKSLTYWQDVWRRLKKNKLSMVGLVAIIFIVLFGFVGPLFTPFKYSDQELDYSNLPPRLTQYQIDEYTYVNVTKEYRVLEITEDGALVGRIDSVYKDTTLKNYYYQKLFDVTMPSAEAGSYPLPDGTTLSEGAIYSNVWGIALLMDENIGGEDTIYIDYIHPDSPFNNLEVEGREFVLYDASSISTITFVNDPSIDNPYYETIDMSVGLENLMLALDTHSYISSLEMGGDLILVDFHYKLMDPEERPDGYEDVEITVTYKGEELKAPTDTVWNKTYVWGTDTLGRDILTRVMFGATISLEVALIATLVNFFIGISYGSISGYFGGRTDNIMMRIVDIINSIPLVLYVILLMVVLNEKIIYFPFTDYIIFRGGDGLGTIIIALGSVYWVGMARLVRGQIIGLKEQEYVLAARTIGVSHRKIIVRHLVPNAMGPIIVSMTMMIPSAVFTEAFLSFIGLGVSAPKASWGTLANDALGGLTTYPFQLFFPAAAIAITMLAFNFLGDGLRDALDPRLRKG